MAIKPLQTRILADKSEGERLSLVILPAGGVQPLVRNDEGAWEYAEPGQEPQGYLVDPRGGRPLLFNPATPEVEHEPWPTGGHMIVGDPPKMSRLSTAWVDQMVARGLVELEGEKIVTVPAGNKENPYAVPPHVFRHADAIVLKTDDGDVRYTVKRQPNKYTGRDNGVGKPTDEVGNRDTSVDWFYDVELDDG